MEKRKIVAATFAGALAVTALLAGTYAWRSMNQQARNEALVQLNPGGRLHDDFNGLRMSDSETNVVKNVYVENFTSKDDGAKIYARIRLDEYMEIGTGAGRDDDSNKSKALVATNPDTADEVKRDDKTTWVTYKWGDSDFRDYIQLNKGGSTTYLPTFNMNKDSLEAEINGTLAGVDGVAYKDYEKYDASKPQTSIEIWSADKDNTDELAAAGFTVEKFIEEVGKANLTNATQTFTVTPDPAAGSTTATPVTCTVMKVVNEKDSTGNEVGKEYYVDLEDPTASDADGADIKIVVSAEHTPKSTLEITEDNVITMETWKSADTSNGGKNCEAGPYWVCDTDGWAYWAQPITPETATGCLINSIQCADKTKLSSEYYYALNVVAQFATAGDWGDATEGSETGFYVDGITEDAVMLLNTAAGALEELRAEITRKAANVTAGDAGTYQTVEIDGQSWKIVAKNAEGTQALLYAATSIDYDGNKTYVWKDTFGDSNSWETSKIRAYLNSTDDYKAGNGFSSKYPYCNALAEKTTIKTRTQIDVQTFVETEDFVFLLSEADMVGEFKGVYDSTTTTWSNSGDLKDDYTVRGSDGNGIKLFSQTSENADGVTSVWSWLRSPRNNVDSIANVAASGSVTTANKTADNGGIRPAFWVSLSSN